MKIAKRNIVVIGILAVSIAVLVICCISSKRFMVFYFSSMAYLTYKIDKTDNDIILEYLIKAQHLDRDSAFTNGNVALHFFHRDEYGLAEIFFENALRSSFNHEYNKALCYCYMQTGKIDQSVECSKDLVSVLPDDAGARSLLGLAHLQSGDTSEATKHFRKAYLMSKDCNAYKYLVDIYYVSGNYQELIKLCTMKQCNKLDNEPFATEYDVTYACDRQNWRK